MTYKLLTTKRVGAVEYVTLNRPEVRNAFNPEMIAELTAWAASTAGTAGTLRAVVLSGAGPSFCAGADAAWMAQTVGYSEAENLRDATAAAQMFRALDELPVPVVGRVHGAALGGGAGLAAICDIVVADREAVFGFTEVRLGLVPAVISPFVLAKIGRSAGRELFLTGARFGATRAYELGLVHAVVPAAELDGKVSSYLAEIALGGPEATSSAKALVREVWGRGLGEAAAITTRVIAARRTSSEGQEGLKAFLDKRTPRWVR